jgi:enoyl-CoA hydratase
LADSVIYSIENGLATARLSRAHGNAINGELAHDLTAVIRDATSDDAVEGLLLAGAGKLFCPGLDLQDLIELDRPEMERFVVDFAVCIADLYAFPKPMVAAIHGHAVAGGCVLTLTADWRVLRPGALVGLNEVRVGVPLPFGVSLILRDSVPRLYLEEIALLGKNYADDAALAAGLVHEIFSGDDFEEHCRDRLREFTTRDLDALMTTKRFLRSSVTERIRDNRHRDVPEFLDAWFRPQTQSRIRGIVEELRARA